MPFNITKTARASLALCSALIVMQAPPANAEDTPPAVAPSGAHDGAHDFDFNFGVWNTHIRRLKYPLSGRPDTVELDGTVTVRKVWGGRAQLEEIETDGPDGHWQGATLFLYDPKAHQWSQNFVGSQSGQLNRPTIGAFKDGRGELYAQDTFEGRAVLIRGVWSDITPDAHKYEESYSDDGGRTWEAVFSASLTRKAP